jgi:vacuolar-type H+-ATPase subunit H
MKSEASIQFDKIFEEHHDPIEKERRKIIENRKKREENIKKDLAMEE